MSDHCIVCNAPTVFSFEKQFATLGLVRVSYFTCTSCGFTYSKTHYDMRAGQWETLNREYHAAYQSADDNPDDPRWLERIGLQATVIAELARAGLVPRKFPWLDYAAGGGQLSEALAREGIEILNYDRYANPPPPLVRSPVDGGYDLVITTSVFEHLRTRDDYEQIQRLVSPEGAMCVHTWVGETVPSDESWFYLLPVHCSFFTNRSMNILMSDWGYRSSLYNVDSRLWVFFKERASIVSDKLRAVLSEDRVREYHVKDGFMDYWK